MDDVWKISHCIIPLTSWSESINNPKIASSESSQAVPCISSGKEMLEEW